jgi:hypothetical protein
MKGFWSLAIANALMAGVVIFTSTLPVQAEIILGDINVEKLSSIFNPFN